MFTRTLFERLVEEEYSKLLAAGNRDVHDDSKATTLPVAGEIVLAYVNAGFKAPWYVDLLNITLGTNDTTQARPRIDRYMSAFSRDGTRITENLDFDAPDARE